jgi:hypothetical protein
LRQIEWDENVKFPMEVPELDAETGGRWVLGLSSGSRPGATRAAFEFLYPAVGL